METVTVEQKNEEIAKMLGFVPQEYNSTTQSWFVVDNYTEKFYEVYWVDLKKRLPVGKVLDLQFHCDWNWIMEAIKFINSTHNHNINARDLTYTLGSLSSGGYWNGLTEKQSGLYFNSIEEVFEAVYRYAKTCNNKKRLEETNKNS